MKSLFSYRFGWLGIMVVWAGMGATGWGAHPLEEWETVYGVPGTRYTGMAASPFGLVVVSDTGSIVSWRFDAPEEKAIVEMGSPLISVAYGPRVFVAISADGIFTSGLDAVDWTHADPGEAEGLREVVFGNNVFLINAGNMLLRSTDGETWTPIDHPQTTYYSRLTFGGGYFFITDFDGDGENYLSTDGLEWSPAPAGTEENLYTVGFGTEQYLAIDIYNTILTSPDAFAWSAQGTLEGIVRPMHLASGKGHVVTAGGNARAFTGDGTHWTVVPTDKHISDVLFADPYFYSAGYDRVQRSGPVTTLRISESGFIHIEGAPGRVLRVESTEELRGSETVWATRESLVSGSMNAWKETEFSAEARFYRVVVEGDE